jgi:hypothetical protein
LRLNLPFYIVREKLAEFRMRFHEPGDVAEVFDPLALPLRRIAKGPQLASQCILQGSDPQQNAVNVGRNGPRREVALP